MEPPARDLYYPVPWEEGGLLSAFLDCIPWMLNGGSTLLQATLTFPVGVTTLWWYGECRFLDVSFFLDGYSHRARTSDSAWPRG